MLLPNGRQTGLLGGGGRLEKLLSLSYAGSWCIDQVN